MHAHVEACTRRSCTRADKSWAQQTFLQQSQFVQPVSCLRQIRWGERVGRGRAGALTLLCGASESSLSACSVLPSWLCLRWYFDALFEQSVSGSS